MNELNIFSWNFSRISTWLFLYILVLLNMLFSFPKAMSDNSDSSVGKFLSCYFRHSSSFSICLVIFWLTTWHCRGNLKHWMMLPFSRKDLLCLWQAVKQEAQKTISTLSFTVVKEEKCILPRTPLFPKPCKTPIMFPLGQLPGLQVLLGTHKLKKAFNLYLSHVNYFSFIFFNGAFVLKFPYYLRQSTDSMQSLSNYQWHFSQNENKTLHNLYGNTKDPK